MRSLDCLPFCLVLFLFCLTAETSQLSSHCCLTTGKEKLPARRVIDYTVQKAGVCPINAIVFLTVRRKIKCADSNSDWVKDVMKKVDQKKALSSQNAKRQKKNNKGKRRRQKNQKKSS
ncbi:C-C motif chemokine 32b.3 [Labeo rohita]|uniref:C-C motif chemokine 32b.3 n=1 Tax=Labeo rohita TaxID=84645 RepID=UPI0021E32BB1|nr:C-C motif chemokine 32b.3 [Labeo rohita]